jgi:hypothetical protein
MDPRVAQIAQTASAVAQVVIAAVAVWLASRANRTTKDAQFVGTIVSELFAIIVEARRVRKLYRYLFDPFGSTAEKEEARTEWLVERESVEAMIADLVSVFPGLAPIQLAWDRVADREDTHVLNDVLKIGRGLMSSAMSHYDEANQAFIREIGRVIMQLRHDGLQVVKRK